MISSALQLTATDELATDENGVPATRLEVGHGRIRVGEAAKAGLYLNETGVRFQNAGPGGSVAPRELNLPSMTDASCAVQCSFKRTLRPLVAGKTWTASVSGFPAGVEVTVTPQQFTLAQGAQQQITVDVDLTNLGQVGGWLSGDVVLSASGVPDAVMPVTVQAATGELPSLWEISSNADAGSVTFNLNSLPALPQATFTAGGLSEPELTEQALEEDETFLDPYDSDEGTYTLWLDVPPDSLLLYASLTAPAGALENLDLDLFVGYDSDRDGRVDAFEERCSSQGGSFEELCSITEPSSGDWWVRVQNWENGEDPDSTDGDPSATELTTAVISSGSDAPLSVSGPGTTGLGESFEVKLAWDNVSARGGQTLVGAVAVGSSQDDRTDIGIVPVSFRRTGIAAPVTTVLHPGRHAGFALAGGARHNKLFVDVPPGVDSLTVSAEGGSNTQSNNLRLELYRRSFDNAFGAAPLAAPLPGGSPVATAMGGGGSGPSLTLSGVSLAQGRWYAVVTNTGGSSASVRVETEFGYDGSPPLMRADLWQSASRLDIGQGLQYIELGANRAVAWYTYDDDGLPTWYLAAGAGPEGNSWSADIQRFTNDGEEQQSNVVGRLSATMLAADDMVFSWTLFGQSGSERMQPSFSDTSCPDIGDGPKNYSGIWSRLPEGKGGASIAMNGNVQAQTHYIYDDQGNPRWLLAPALLSSETITLSQYSGFCPNCSGSISDQAVGTVTRDFDTEDSGGWTLDYLLAPPLSADVQRTDNAQRLSSSAACQ